MGVLGGGAAGCRLLRIDKRNGGTFVTIGAKPVPGLIDLISPKAGSEMPLLFLIQDVSENPGEMPKGKD
jgi:hypothetical protein